jgi:hypothetical protein
MTIKADTAELLRTADVLWRQAGRIEACGIEAESLIGARPGFSLFFWRNREDARLKKAREALVGRLRAQSLFLRECARKYRVVQSRTIARAGRI